MTTYYQLMDITHEPSCIGWMEKERMDAASGFLEDIQFIRSKINRLKGMLEDLVD